MEEMYIDITKMDVGDVTLSLDDVCDNVNQ